jgi:hypothetical protein
MPVLFRDGRLPGIVGHPCTPLIEAHSQLTLVRARLCVATQGRIQNSTWATRPESPGVDDGDERREDLAYAKVDVAGVERFPVRMLNR